MRAGRGRISRLARLDAGSGRGPGRRGPTRADTGRRRPSNGRPRPREPIAGGPGRGVWPSACCSIPATGVWPAEPCRHARWPRAWRWSRPFDRLSIPTTSGCTGRTTCLSAGRKLSGILIDVLADGRHMLGIGLNVNNRFDDAPADVRARATSMIDSDRPQSRPDRLAGRPARRTGQGAVPDRGRRGRAGRAVSRALFADGRDVGSRRRRPQRHRPLLGNCARRCAADRNRWRACGSFTRAWSVGSAM